MNNKNIEEIIDDLDSKVSLPPNFILPGASPGSAALDLVRSSLRSAERRIIALFESGDLENNTILW